MRKIEEEGIKCASSTDPDARFMRSQEGKHPSYNAQLAVDAKHRMIVAAEVSRAGSDHGQLEPMLEQVMETRERTPVTASADAGYRKTQGLVALEKYGVTGYIARQKYDRKRFTLEDFIYNDEHDEYVCPQGQVLEFLCEKKDGEEVYQCEDCSSCTISQHCLKKPNINRTLRILPNVDVVQKLHLRMRSPFAKYMLSIRAQTVELVFAWIKTQRKLRKFLFRGINNVKDEWKFEAAAQNVRTLINFRMQRTN